VRAAIPARAARYAASERSERRHAKDRLGFYLAVAAQMGFDIKGRRRQEFPPAEAGGGASVGLPSNGERPAEEVRNQLF